jgi:hypothetical protein
MPRAGAIVVGSTYGQDALAVSSFAAMTGQPLFFINDPANAQGVLADLASRNYPQVLLYGSIAHQIPPSQLALLPHRRTIDTGNRYANNVQIASEFLNLTPATQVMLVSGKTFEKSMVDQQFPLILVGRSEASSEVSRFIQRAGIVSGVVYSGDADIVDGVTRLREQVPNLSLFVKFGEGYVGAAGSAQPLPLAIVPLPAPTIALEVLNLTYNVPAKAFELRIANRGDFAALTGGVNVSGAGAAVSSQILMDPNTTTTLSIPLDASAAVASPLGAASGGRIRAVILTLHYGEDSGLMDNLDTISFTNVPTSFYNDTSAVRLTGISYSDEQKAFIISLEGEGWAAGTLDLTLNGKPLSVRFPPTHVSGSTQIVIKYLLTADQQKSVDGLSGRYFLRTGAQQDILLKEKRGQSPIQGTHPLFGDSSSLPVLPLCAIALVVIIAFVAYQRLGGAPPSSGGFD